MRTTSACLGLVLAAVCVAGGFVAGGGTPMPLPVALGAGAGLAVFAVWTFRRRRWAQVLLSLTGLALLGRFLPVYFQTAQMWPFLAVVILGSGTFGLGILGVLLDAYGTEQPRRRGSGTPL